MPHPGLTFVGYIELAQPVDEQSRVPVAFDPGRGLFLADLGSTEFESKTYADIGDQLQEAARRLNLPNEWQPYYAVWVLDDDRIEVGSCWLSPDQTEVRTAGLTAELEVVEVADSTTSPLASALYRQRMLQRSALLLATPVVRSTLQKIVGDTSEVHGAIEGMRKRLRQSVAPLAAEAISDRAVDTEDEVLQLLVVADSEPQVFAHAIDILRTIVIRANFAQGNADDMPKGFQVVTAGDVESIRSLLAQVGVDPFEGIDPDPKPDDAEEHEYAKKAARSWSRSDDDVIADALVDGLDGVDRIEGRE
jgi:hypothetical protein